MQGFWNLWEKRAFLVDDWNLKRGFGGIQGITFGADGGETLGLCGAPLCGRTFFGPEGERGFIFPRGFFGGVGQHLQGSWSLSLFRVGGTNGDLPPFQPGCDASVG